MRDTAFTSFAIFDFGPFFYSAFELTDDLEVQFVGVKFNQDFGCFRAGEWVQYLVVRFAEGKMVEYSKDGVRGRMQEFRLKNVEEVE